MVETPIMIPAIHHFRYQRWSTSTPTHETGRTPQLHNSLLISAGGWMMTGKYYAAILYHTPGNNLWQVYTAQVNMPFLSFPLARHHTHSPMELPRRRTYIRYYHTASSSSAGRPANVTRLCNKSNGEDRKETSGYAGKPRYRTDYLFSFSKVDTGFCDQRCRPEHQRILKLGTSNVNIRLTP